MDNNKSIREDLYDTLISGKGECTQLGRDRPNICVYLPGVLPCNNCPICEAYLIAQIDLIEASKG